MSAKCTVKIRIAALASSLVLLVLLAVSVRSASGQSPNRAGVVVRLADGRVETRCVAFDQDEISGYELLQRAGLSLETRFEGGGGIMCRIEDVGCPSSDCFCECPGGDECVYWSYWQLGDAGWRYARLGATSYLVSDGDVDGWSWGPGNLSGALEPPLMTFDEVCGTAVGTSLPTTGKDLSPASWLPLAAFAIIAGVLVLVLLLVRRPSNRL